MDIARLIQTRRSVRRFKKQEISAQTIACVLQAGRWAPSGLNNQPWRFMVLVGLAKDSLCAYTRYGHTIKNADTIIVVFLDTRASYHRDKDLMAIGASIQNMLLYIHSIGLGACWLGEIINRRTELARRFNFAKNLELVAVIALGKPLLFPKRGKRKPLKKIMTYLSKFTLFSEDICA